jgi:hypothetical protein
MLLTTLLLPMAMAAAPDPETAVDAERAFNRAAQTEGQWTAFRRFMTDDAVIFTPQPTRAKDALPEKNPPIAVQWWPAESYVSCDGTMAVNTGPWVRPKANGYFTTVWERQADGHYKWSVDGGDALATPRALPERPRARRASCNHKQLPSLTWIIPTGGGQSADSQSRDGSLRWFWQVRPNGARAFFVELWDGRNFVEVLRNEIAAAQ